MKVFDQKSLKANNKTQYEQYKLTFLTTPQINPVLSLSIKNAFTILTQVL